MPCGQTYGYAQIFILQICHMGRLMPKFLYFKYSVWADLCPIFYTSNMSTGQTYGYEQIYYTANMPYGQTYVQIFILQICHMGRLMPNF